MSEKNCTWHKNEDEIDSDIGCSECGRLIDTRVCENCGKTFLDWESENLDDVVAPPGVTASGDFMCRWCANRHDAEEEQMWEDEGDYFPYPY